MNDSTSSGAPVVPGEFIIPSMEDFFSSISMEQTVDLAVGEPDADTLSKIKELVLNVADECTGFIYIGRFTSGDVETAVGESVLTSFENFLVMRRTTQPKSFDTFNKQFVKLVKAKVSYFLGPMDNQLAFYVSVMDRVDIMLPHAVRLLEELLVEKSIQHEQRKQNVAKDQQDALNRQQTEELQPISSDLGDSQTVDQESDLKLVDEFISEELSAMNKEKELDLKMVDEFISEELSAMNKERESGLKMVEKFIPEELSEMNKEKWLELKMVDRFISEEGSAMNKERESGLKMVEKFIPEEHSEMNKESELKMVDRFISKEVLEVSKEKESELKMVNKFITEEPSEVKEIKKIISKHQQLETQDNSEDIIEPGNNQGLNGRAVSVTTAKQQNKGVGARIKTFFQKYSQRRYKRVAPQQPLAVKEEPSEEETDVAGLKKSVSEKQIVQGVNRKGQELKPGPEVTTLDVEPAPLASGSEKEERQSSISLLINALVMQAVTKSVISCNYKDVQAIIKRLSEKLCAEVEGEDLKEIQKSLKKLSVFILRAVSERTGWSQADLYVLLDLKDSNVEKATLSLCREKILKTAEKPILKRVFSSVGKALSKPFKKF